MKKVIFALVALLTLGLTGCKVENSKVSVYVENSLGQPVPNRYVFYADWASLIIDAALPSPEELATDTSDAWEYAKTNAAGFVDITIPLGVSKLKYEFMVWDEGLNKWIQQTVELHRGQNEEISFKVQS